MSEKQAALKSHLEKHWLSWLALRHFLTAPLLKTLLEILVAKISKGDVKLSDLFEDRSEQQTPALESWSFRARPVDGELAQYLQRRVQHILWQNDTEAYPPNLTETNPELGGSFDVEAAIEFGAADFSTDERSMRPVRQSDPSLVLISEIMRQVKPLVRESAASYFSAKIVSPAKELEWPLSSVVIKHFGDLSGDADCWAKAHTLYAAARDLIPADVGPWTDYVQAFEDILVQSEAAAARFVDGPAQSAHILHQALEGATLKSRPILAMNGPFDAMIANILTGDMNFRDNGRSTMLFPPLYAGSHDLSNVQQYLNQHKFSDANRVFWSVLRRQIALGLIADTAATRSAYGCSLLLELEHDDRRRTSPGSFSMAVRLLIEGADYSMLKVYVWPEVVLKEYLSPAVVDDAIQVVLRYPNAKIDRQKAIVEIFRAWVSAISDDQRDLAGRMLHLISELAAEGHTGFLSNVDVGGRALEVLEEVADARPEFKRLISDQICETVLTRLKGGDGWQPQQKALKLAIEFADVFSESQIREVLESTLRLLNGIDPANQVWPLTQPALELLTSKRSSKIAQGDPAFGKTVLETILRFGNEQSTESSSLLFRLRDFDAKLLSNPSIVESVKPAVAEVRRATENINSSASVANIQALLLSPTVSGTEGVDAALQSLFKIISSAQSRSAAISLPYAYAPVLMLADRQKAFADELHVSENEIGNRWSKIYSAITDLWGAATARPLVFAGFALPPPTKPNPVIVHNWAYASLKLAQTLNRKDDMVSTLTAAAKQQELKDPIALALATGTGPDESVDIRPDSIHSEPPDTFYAALGRRLAVISKLPEDDARILCEALLKQCLRYGPRQIDAAVLVLAIRFELAAVAKGDLGTNYSKRVSAKREARFALTPLLFNLGVEIY